MTDPVKNITNPQPDDQQKVEKTEETTEVAAKEIKAEETVKAESSAKKAVRKSEKVQTTEEESPEKPAGEQALPKSKIEDDEYWEMQDEGVEYTKDEFEQMMKMYDSTLTSIEEGQVITGKVLRISGTHVVLDIGFKSEGAVPIEEFKSRDEVKEGEVIEVYLESLEDEDGVVVLSKKKADFLRVWDRIRRAHEEDALVEGTVVRRIKGGVVVDLLGVDAFLPGSQIALRRIPNMDELIGQNFKFKIIKINKRRRNIVISRRVILEGEREQKKEKLLQELEVNQVREGVVKNITDFGAFIDLGGVDGLLHITDMSWGRVSHPSEMVALGDKIQVKILDLDFENGRISLGHKQLTPYPWENAAEKYPVGSKVRGKVVSITNYGAFVELEKGIEGLVHISEMSWTRHIRHPSKVVAIGDIVEAMVLNINPEEEKISLGIKQMEADPWKTLSQKYPVGTVIDGRVRNLTSYGAFVEIEEGIDGLVHISDMSWTKRVHHPSEVVKKGDKVQVVVLNMDTDNKRISLGMKQLIENPWDRLKDNYPVGIEIDCPIVRLLEKGVVVDLGNDIEGFVPISQLGIKGAVNNPADVLIIGDVLQLKVIEVDSENHRIVLAVRDMAEIKKLVKERLKAAQKSKAAEQEELATEIPAEEKVEVEEKAEPAAQTETAAVSVEEPTAQVPDQTAEKEKEQEVKEKKPKGETRKRAAKQQKVSAQENLSEEQDKVGEAKLEEKEETEPDRKEEVSSPELKADEKSDEESANVEKVENS